MDTRLLEIAEECWRWCNAEV